MGAFATNCFRPGGVTGLNLENRHRLSYFSHNLFTFQGVNYVFHLECGWTEFIP